MCRSSWKRQRGGAVDVGSLATWLSEARRITKKDLSSVGLSFSAHVIRSYYLFSLSSFIFSTFGALYFCNQCQQLRSAKVEQSTMWVSYLTTNLVSSKECTAFIHNLKRFWDDVKIYEILIIEKLSSTSNPIHWRVSFTRVRAFRSRATQPASGASRWGLRLPFRKMIFLSMVKKTQVKPRHLRIWSWRVQEQAHMLTTVNKEEVSNDDSNAKKQLETQWYRSLQTLCIKTACIHSWY